MALSQLFNQTITHYALAGYDRYGQQQHGTSGTTLKVRLEQKRKYVTDTPDHTILIEAFMYAQSSADIAIDDKIIASDVVYRVFAKKPAIDGQGNTHHIKYELIKAEV